MYENYNFTNNLILINLLQIILLLQENEEEDYIAYVGEITSALVRLHGTKIMPLHYEFGPRKYEPL